MGCMLCDTTENSLVFFEGVWLAENCVQERDYR